MKLSGSTAVVTGANRGLGRCFVEGLITQGAARVYGGARDPESLAHLQALCGDRVVPLRIDVTDPASVAQAAARASDATLLINNAGVLESRGLMEAGDLSTLEREMAVNVFGLARMTLALAPVIEANGGGAVVNMLSVASLIGFAPFGSYCATKAAAMSLTHSLRYELKDRGIEVFGVYASFIDTGMIGYIDAEKATPESIVTAALEGVEANCYEIDADQRAKDVRAKLREDPAGLEASSWERADWFRKAHPLDPAKS